MAQLNIHVTEEFEAALLTFMRIRGIQTKSEAVRTAVREGVEHALRRRHAVDHHTWIGRANEAATNPNPKFLSEDDLWESG